MLRTTVCALGLAVGLTLTVSAAPVRVNLRTELDSRSAKADDTVQAKLEAPLSVNGLIVLKGATLFGHVQQVMKKDAHGRAEITLVFDKVAAAGSQSMMVTAKIVTVRPSRYQQIPSGRCDGIAMEELSAERSAEAFCTADLRYKVLHEENGSSGTVTRQKTVRGPVAEASVKGPLLLAKGTLMEMEILPVR